jgi:Ca2+-binding RTX toxin-like protein
MSFHFLSGNTYGPYSDTGPGSIIVDALANVVATGSDSALTLASGPWTITVNGNIGAENGYGIDLKYSGAFVSTIRIGANTEVASANDIAINTHHGVNVVNAGRITSGFIGIQQDIAGDYTIKNLKSGVIEGTTFAIDAAGLGTHRVLNAGTIGSPNGSVSGGDGVELVTNWGQIFGNVDLGDGNDVFTNFKRVGTTIKSGTLNGDVYLGFGDDKFFGGNRAETVTDGHGADTVNLGGGNDTWIAYLKGNGDLIDSIDGGKGIDTYDASQSGINPTGANFINLDSVSHGGIAANKAVEYDASPHDIIRNFENAIGSNGYDGIYGTNGVNKLWGGGGNDGLNGFGGNDLLSGDSGADQLVGGAGKDELWGGADVDTFTFESLKDSGPTKASRDTIHDFEVGTDHIFLGHLNQKLGGIITAFLGVDVAFTGHKGDLRAVTSGDQTLVQLDVNGDKKADFSIALDGHHALTIDDFIF